MTWWQQIAVPVVLAAGAGCIAFLVHQFALWVENENKGRRS